MEQPTPTLSVDFLDCLGNRLHRTRGGGTETIEAIPLTTEPSRYTRNDRQLDILAEFPGRGSTIGVEIGDEHYEKTLQTAYLVEKRYRENPTKSGELDWAQFLQRQSVPRDVIN